MQGRRFNRQTLTIGAVALIVLIAGALVLGGTDLFGTAGEQPTEEPPEVAQQPPTEQPSDDAGPAPAATEEPPGDQPPVEEPPPPPAQPPEDQPPPTEQPPVVEPPPPATEPPPVVEPPPPATEEPPVGDQPPADEKPPATEDVPLASTEEATEAPVEEPTAEPTEAPTEEPAEEPTAEPTEVATEEVTAEPTEEATEEPTAEPTEEPTEEPAALQAEADVMEPFALVDPEPVGGNPTCGSLGLPDGVTFDPPNPVSGYNAGPGTISWSFSAGAYQVNWSSTFGISAVIMKGGQVGANVYRYDPPALGDSGLITANNPSGQPADLSHLVFCYDEARVPQAAGGLDVTKVVDWNGVPVDGTQTFEICITGPSYPDGDCQSVGANGGTVSWPGLDAGDYTVTETDPGAVWTVSGSGVSVAIADDQTASATITNTHDPLPPPLDAYQIFISKAWLDASMNSTDAPALSGDFAITATSSIGQATCTWSGGSLGCSYTNQIPPALNNDGLWVPAGESYTVSEAGLPAGWYGISGVGTFPATWGSCDGTTCLHTVQNQSSAGGRVVVTKTVDWNGTTPDPTQTFEFCIFGPSFVSPPYNCQTVGPNGGTVSWADLMPGQYDVVESTLDPIWVVGPTRIQKATIIDVNTVELAYTNTYGSPSGPSLSVEGTCDMATGQVTFTLTNNGSAMSAGVPYTISNADGTIASGTTDALGAGASQTFLPPIQTGGGTMTFETTGTGGLYAYAEVDDCFAPSGPSLSVEGTCDIATGQVTFTLNNNGAAMSAGVPYTISNADGTIASGTTDALGAGASQTFLPPIQTGGGTMTFETTGTGGLYAYAEVDDCFAPSGPSLSVEGTCDMTTGQVTFTLTNNGAAMSAGVPYTISNADGTIASGTTDALGAGASQTFLPPIQTGGGTMTFETTGTGGLYAYAEVDDCFAPGDPRGRVEVTKVVDWNGFTPDPSQTFEFCIFGPSFVDPPYNCQTVGANGGTVAWDNLLPGEYDIVESTLGTVWVVSPDRIQKAFVVGGDVIQLEYTNRYNPPNLVAEGTCDTATGQVTFTLTNTGSAMSDGVPYTIINDNGTIASGTTDALGAGGTQTFTVPVQVDGGTIVFATTGPEGLSTSAEVDDCLAPVNLDVSGTCDTATGQVTFTLTNTGQAMSAGVPYTITNDNGTIASGTTDALGPNESQTFTVPVQVDGGTIVFETTGTGGLYASAEIDDCLAPVNLDVSGTCDTATGQVTFTLTNTGQAMSAGVPYTISNDNGTIMSGTTDALAPNGSQIFLVPLQVDGGTVVFETTGTGGLYAYAEVDDCLAPVNLVAEGECDVATGQVTFTLTNLGQAMSSGVQYTIYTDNRDLQSGITDALGPNETQQFVVDARPNGATIYFMANGMLVPAETTDCFALDKVIFDAECTVDAVATFTITNNGGPMSQTAPYEIVNEDGDVVGSGSYQLGAGQSTSATVSGYYGEIRFNQPGAKTVTTYCAPPPPPPPPPPPTQTEEPEEPEATEEPPGPQGPVAVAQAVCGETTETGLNGFPVIGMNPEDCVDEPLPAPEWEPLEIGEAVCPDWFVYHTNMTGDWEVFRLGELLNNPGAEPNLTQGVGPRVYDVAPSRSPDAEWITFASNRDGNWEIYIGRADGSEQRRVTYNTTAIDIDPMWSPDGNWIVYDSARDGNWELYMINVGTGVEVRLTDDPGNDLNAFWAPDGTKLVFQSDRDGLWQVYELEIATLEVTRLSDGEGDDHDPQYSFDGEQVAFRSYRNGENSVIYKMDADGANVEAVSDLTADATNHAWSDDDSLIAYQSDLDGDLDIYVFEVETGETRLVTDNDIPDYAPTWWCQSPVLIFTSDITGDANIFDTPALPMDADPIDVLREASQLTTDEESDQFPENTPSEENASRQRSLPSPAKNR